MNPYVSQVVNSTMANMNELNGQQQQQVVGNAISKGAMGGNRVGVAQSELARQQNLANQQTISGLYNDAYNNALGASQQQQQTDISAGTAAMNAGLSQAGAQLGAGTQQQQFDYQQFLNQQGYPYQNLSWLSSVLGNSAVGGTTTTTQPYGNTASSLLGAGLGIASLFRDGGRVRRAGGGGVVPYNTNANAFMQGNSGWGGYVLDKGSPYSSDSSIYLPYIPVDSGGNSHSNDFPDAVDPLKDIDGADDDPFGDYTSAAGKKGAGNIKSWLKSMFGSSHLATGLGESGGYGSSYASGGVIPRQHLASGGVSDFYSGIIQPQGGLYNPGPAVMMPSNGQFSGLGVAATGGGSDPVGPGLNNPDFGGWSGFQDFASEPTSSYPNANDTVKSIPYVGGSGGAGATVDGANPIDIGRWGLTTDPFRSTPSTSVGLNAKGSAGSGRGSFGSGSLTGDGYGGLDFSGPNNDVGDGTGGNWDGLRSPEEETQGVVPRQGFGARPTAITVRGGQKQGGLFGMGGHPLGALASAISNWDGHPASVQTAPGERPITYGAPVAAGSFAQGSPNQSFEKQNGMGSVTDSMASSSRWNTGYADGGTVGSDGGVIDWEHTGLDGLMGALKHYKLHWRGRAQSDNIEDHRDPIAKMLTGDNMATDHFGFGQPPLPADHFNNDNRQGFASGGSKKSKASDVDVGGLYAGILNPDAGGLAGDTGRLMTLDDPAASADPAYAADTGSNDAFGIAATSDPDADAAATQNSPDDMGLNSPGNGGGLTQPSPYFDGLHYDASDYGNGNGVVPYTSGDNFTTKANPQYSQNIGDVFSSLGKGKGLNLSPDVRQALLAAGFGMMAGKSPGFLQNVGAGGLAGIETWQKRQDIERDNAKARADIGQTGEQIASSAATTQAQLGEQQVRSASGRFAMTPVPGGGYMVTDVLRPGTPVFVPLGGILPDGTKAVPPDNSRLDPAGGKPLFDTQAPQQPMNPLLLSPTTAPLVIDETNQGIAKAREGNQSAILANQQIADLQHSLDTLPAQGWLSQGAGFDDRLAIAKNINVAAQVAGFKTAPFAPDEIAAGEDANKVTTRLGQSLAAGLGSDPAASIVMQSVGAVPGGVNSKAGAERIIGAIQAANQRQTDYYTFLQRWRDQNRGSISGADQYFNFHNPPELYALSAYVPSSALMALKAHPEKAAEFNKKYGNGRNVAQYVVGR